MELYFFHSTIDTPPGCPGGSTDRENPTEFEFLGLRCDHEVLKHLEAKNLVKIGIFDDISSVLRGFWLLAALKPHGRIPNLEIPILWVFPDL